MEWHPLFQYMVRLLRVRSLRFRMSEFGAPTKKPTILYASAFDAFSSRASEDL